ncbi:hypothetical protein ACI48D_20620 [Massilia sp. LXY-6]|uniref:hypothetical protein n=1 Tax=Massilia sp. LXY-6 TaxID=3379823 RepID=UPI003EDF66A3
MHGQPDDARCAPAAGFDRHLKKAVRLEDSEHGIGEMDLVRSVLLLQQKNAPSAAREIRAVSFSLITLPFVVDKLGQ